MYGNYFNSCKLWSWWLDVKKMTEIVHSLKNFFKVLFTNPSRKEYMYNSLIMTYYGNTHFGYGQGCPQYSFVGVPPLHECVPPFEGLVCHEPLPLVYIIFLLQPSSPWLSG